MFSRTIRKFKLFLRPPKKGDVFYGDPLWFVIHRPIEYILHGLKDKNGTTIHHPIPSKDCFCVVIEHCGNENYIVGTEVFCDTKTNNNIGIWFKRSQPKRIAKEMFEELVLNGLLWRSND
jgi:hypothetical protein